jgi:hypothetical protein
MKNASKSEAVWSTAGVDASVCGDYAIATTLTTASALNSKKRKP